MSDIHTVARLRAEGKEIDARQLWEALNRINAAFDQPEWPYPKPARPVATGFVWAPAEKVSPAEFLKAVRPGIEFEDEPLSELRHPEGWSHAA